MRGSWWMVGIGVLVGFGAFIAGQLVAPPGADAPAAVGASEPEAVERQRVLTLYSEAKRASDDALAKQQYQQAQSQAQQALDLAKQNLALFTDIEVSVLRDGAQRQLDNVNSRWDAYKAEQAQILADKTRGEETRRQQAAAEVRKAKVAALVADARKLYDATQFREAADLLRQATVIDPQDEHAQLMLRLVMTKIVDRDYEAILHRTGQEVPRNEVTSTRPAGISSPFGMITVTSSMGLPAAPEADSAANRAARDRLEENIKEIVADQQGLEKVLNFLRDNMGANIFVNWTALQQAKIERTSPVSVSQREVPFRKVLTTILSQISTPDAQLTYIIDDGIITISTKKELASPKYQSVREIDIRGLLPPPVAQNGAAQTAPAARASEDPRRKEAIDNLIKTIEATVSPDSGRDNGGTIRELNGQFVVNQTRDNHRAVYNLLMQLAESRGVHVAMESRILLVADNFLNDFRPEWNLQGPLTDPPGIRVQGTVLDNWHLDEFLTAVRANRGILTTTMPRTKLGNGLEGRITSAPAKPYITGYVAKNVGDAVQYEPEFGATGPAISLSLVPTVSQDRRYVQTRLTVNVQRLTRLDHAPAPNTSAEKGLQIDKPVLSTATAEFDVAVQDGGTILLDAGLIPADALELKAADGQPKDAKLQGDVRMLIIVRPMIIIHREIEIELFGVGYDRPTGLTPTPLQPATQK